MEFVLQEEIKINFCQTYVIQVEPNERDRVRRWASAQIDTDLIGAYGEIFLENKYNILVTFASAFRKDVRYQKIQEELKKYKIEGNIKISPLTRRKPRGVGLGE